MIKNLHLCNLLTQMATSNIRGHSIITLTLRGERGQIKMRTYVHRMEGGYVNVNVGIQAFLMNYLVCELLARITKFLSVSPKYQSYLKYFNKNFLKQALCSRTSIFNSPEKRATNNFTISWNHVIKFKTKTANFHSKFITTM